MDIETRAALTKDLSRISVELAAAIRPALLAAGPTRERAEALHREEHVGAAFDLWTDLLSRRAAVLWVLRSLYLRILEDRELTRPKRILDPEGEQLFALLAPGLGPTAYLRWAYRDLALSDGGLPELFAAQPAELVPVPDAMTRKLIDLWRSRDPDTQALRYRFDHERFDSRLMGDLYQDLDPVVKKRYALLQTPDFVLDFILDETLTPAIAQWGVETVRVLDPACGSGHFLLAAFQRLVARMRSQSPKRPVREIVQDALSRVVGIDLNDYACALARARLVMTALELCREVDPSLDLRSAAEFHPHVYCADALEQVEDEQQLDLAGIPASHQASRGLMTPLEVRAALAPELRARFHVVVGNPPYDQERDESRRDYHRARVGRRRRYLSANGKYSLSAPFVERMLRATLENANVGVLLGNTFMRKPFGRALIREVLTRYDVLAAVDLSGIRFPGPGVPTVILLLRHRRPSELTWLAVGKKSSPSQYVGGDQPAWRSILAARAAQPSDSEDEYISARQASQKQTVVHPWTLADVQEDALKHSIEAIEGSSLDRLAILGVIGMTNAGDCLILPPAASERLGVPSAMRRPLCQGEDVRDWTIAWSRNAMFPYAASGALVQDGIDLERLQRVLWPFRTTLWARATFDRGTYRSTGRDWWEWHQLAHDRVAPNKILYPELASTPSFAVDESGGLAVQDVFAIVPRVSEVGESLAIAAALNSSVGLFWIKKVFQNKGYSAGKAGRVTAESWDNFFQATSTALASFVVPNRRNLLVNMGNRLRALQSERAVASAHMILVREAHKGAASLRDALAARRENDFTLLAQVVALHEELDWLCYALYGIQADVEVRAPDQVPPLCPGHRPFELALAREDAERRDALARGEEPDEQPTAWFERHGWTPETSLDAVPEAHRRFIADRLERTEASRELGLLEKPTYKRRWYRPNHAEEEQAAFTRFLDDRIEAWVKERKEPFTVGQVAAGLRGDAAFLAVGELLTGQGDFDVDALIAQRIRAESVPNNKHHVFKPEGLKKRAGWERTWQAQHEEDAGKKVTPEVPEKYDRTDYQKGEYWTHRGKLDVPKERFIAFTEVPPLDEGAALYGWAGWTPRERARALLGLDERLEAAGVPVSERYGVLYGVWFLLPYVAWESASAASDLRADVISLVGKDGVTDALLETWAEAFAAKRAGEKKKPKKAVAPKQGRKKKDQGDA